MGRAAWVVSAGGEHEAPDVRGRTSVSEIRSIESLDRALQADKEAGRFFQVLVWSPDSAPSRQFKTTFETVSKEHAPKVRFYLINAKEVKGARNALGFESTPVVLGPDPKKKRKSVIWDPILLVQRAKGSTLEQVPAPATVEQYGACLRDKLE